MPLTERRDLALVQLGRLLRGRGYRFTTITPESHRRVNARPGNAVARTLRDVFGWSRPFTPNIIPVEMLTLLSDAGCVIQDGPMLRAAVRFSSAGHDLYVHSAFPTTQSDSVFFGPDTYRYLDLLRRLAPRARRAIDIGCGTGAGGLSIAPSCTAVVLSDINESALRYARVNAAINEVENAEAVRADVLAGVEGSFDLVISNPPYLIDDQARLYRDGRGRFGEGLSVEITRQSIERLERGGRLILYTATAVVDGVDTFRESVSALLTDRVTYRYEEIDPDVFGEELDRSIYGSVDRIAVVALDLTTAGR